MKDQVRLLSLILTNEDLPQVEATLRFDMDGRTQEVKTSEVSSGNASLIRKANLRYMLVEGINNAIGHAQYRRFDSAREIMLHISQEFAKETDPLMSAIKQDIDGEIMLALTEDNFHKYVLRII